MKLRLLCVSFAVVTIAIAMESPRSRSVSPAALDFLNWLKGGEPFDARSAIDKSLVFKRMISNDLADIEAVKEEVFSKLRVILSLTDRFASIHKDVSRKKFVLKNNESFIYFYFPTAIAGGLKKLPSMQGVVSQYRDTPFTVLWTPEDFENDQAWHAVLGAVLGGAKDEMHVGLLAARFLASTPDVQQGIISVIKWLEWNDVLKLSFRDFLKSACQRAIVSFGENNGGAALFGRQWVCNISDDKCLEFVQNMAPIIIDKKDVTMMIGKNFFSWHVMDNGALRCLFVGGGASLLFNTNPPGEWLNPKKESGAIASAEIFERRKRDFIRALESKTSGEVQAISIDRDCKIALAAIKKEREVSVIIAKRYTKGSELCNLTLAEIDALLPECKD